MVLWPWGLSLHCGVAVTVIALHGAIVAVTVAVIAIVTVIVVIVIAVTVITSLLLHIITSMLLSFQLVVGLW